MRYWIRQFFTRPRTHWKAFAEVGITATFSLIPLLISAVVFNFHRETGFEIGSVVDRALGQGQLFLYAFGLCGTILWLAFIRWDRPVDMPQRVVGLLTILGTLFIVALLGVDPAISTVRNESIITASYVAYPLFLVFNYLLLFYSEIEPPSARDSIRRGSAGLQQAYRNLGDAE